jgi:hypothetical protein
MKITDKDLQMLIERLNKNQGFGRKPKLNTPGAYTLSNVSGKVSLHQNVDESGSVRDFFGCAHVTKSNLYDRINAYLLGLNAKKEV